MVLLAIGGLAGCQRNDKAPEPVGAATGAKHPDAAAPVSREIPRLPNPLPGRRRDLTAAVGAASRAAIGDLDGDGKNEIVLADAENLRVIDPSGKQLASTPVPGGIQVLIVADLDGDRHAEVIAGSGLSREHKDATARVTIYRLDHGKLVEEPVLAPQTSRAEIVELLPIAEPKPALLIAYFDSKYTVRSVIAQHGSTGWTTSDVASIRMATSYARGDLGTGKPELVVGRVYGDDKTADGDAFVLAADGTRTPIPTTRGVRSVAVADLDGDGKAEVYLADGWHQNYGQIAHGLLTCARRTESGFRSELVEDTAGQFTVGRILTAKLESGLALVTMGNLYVRAFTRDGDRWHGLTIAGVARDIAVGDLDGAAGDEILIVGDHSEIVNLGTALRP